LIISQQGDKHFQGDQKIGGQFAQVWKKVAQTVAKPKKCQNVFIKARFENKKNISFKPLLNS
jgi:hypothetical protein